MTNRYPRLKARIRKRKSGKVVTYYFYDNRSAGKPDISLGTDYNEAVRKWDALHNLRSPLVEGTLEEAFIQWEMDVLPEYENKETRKGYAKNLRALRPVFGSAAWESVQFVHLKSYLTQRSAKTQANREISLLSVIWNWARGVGLTHLPFPAAGMERTKWKNKEKARVFHVDDEIFNAVYEFADQTLRDALDIATATGMRVNDVIDVEMPINNILRQKASKTEKEIEFDVSTSPVLLAIIGRRQKMKCNHNKLLSNEHGRALSYTRLRERWVAARDSAADFFEKKGELDTAKRIRDMMLRDMRKRAAELAGSVESASELLQHSSIAVTKKHYLNTRKAIKPVR